jgi:lipid A 4'-phosphatase
MPIFFLLFTTFLTLPVVWPQVDLVVSGLFYPAGQGFWGADKDGFLALHFLASSGARVLGVDLLVLALASWLRHRDYLFPAKAWLYLFFALLIGPGLVANVGFKDHWGRARPREVVEFGGHEAFSPALTPHFENMHSNGSFVAGDAAFGFFLPSFGYVTGRRWKRRAFWGGMAAGVAFGFARLAMGAHFFSDVVYAAFLMLAVCAGVHAAMYGASETVLCWKAFFMSSDAAGRGFSRRFQGPPFRSGSRDKTGAGKPTRRRRNWTYRSR